MGNKNRVYKSLLIAGTIVIMIDGRENCNCELACVAGLEFACN